MLEKSFESVKAKVYPMDIESIVINLLTNAYTACLQNINNRLIKILLIQEEQDNVEGYSIAISNSGPSIDKNLTDWIWEPLTTLKKDSTGKEIGTGLGLTIVKSTVDALRGIKTVDNDPVLGGAVFKIWLPLK